MLHSSRSTGLDLLDVFALGALLARHQVVEEVVAVDGEVAVVLPLLGVADLDA